MGKVTTTTLYGLGIVARRLLSAGSDARGVFTNGRKLAGMSVREAKTRLGGNFAVSVGEKTGAKPRAPIKSWRKMGKWSFSIPNALVLGLADKSESAAINMIAKT